MEYLRHALEINASLLPIVNANQKMVNKTWMLFPRRLLQMNAVLPCVIGTHVHLVLHMEHENENEKFLQDLGREFYPHTEEPPVFLCNPARGSRAAAFLHRLRTSGSKPSLATLRSDPAALEYFVRVQSMSSLLFIRGYSLSRARSLIKMMKMDMKPDRTPNSNASL